MRRIIFLLAGVLFLLGGCEKEDSNSPQLLAYMVEIGIAPDSAYIIGYGEGTEGTPFILKYVDDKEVKRIPAFSYSKSFTVRYNEEVTYTAKPNVAFFLQSNLAVIGYNEFGTIGVGAIKFYSSDLDSINYVTFDHDNAYFSYGKWGDDHIMTAAYDLYTSLSTVKVYNSQGKVIREKVYDKRAVAPDWYTPHTAYNELEYIVLGNDAILLMNLFNETDWRFLFRHEIPNKPVDSPRPASFTIKTHNLSDTILTVVVSVTYGNLSKEDITLKINIETGKTI